MDFFYSQINNNTIIEPSIFAHSFQFGPGQLTTIRVLGRIFASISGSGLLCVFGLFWFFKKIRSFALELVVWLCFNNMLFNISYFFLVPDKIEDDQSASCLIQAFLNTMFDLSSMTWTTLVGFTAYISVLKQDHLENNKMKYRIAYHIIAFFGPLIFAIIPFFTNNYMVSGAWCWIDSEGKGQNTGSRALIGVYYAIVWILILSNVYFVYKLIQLLKIELSNEQELIAKYTNKLKWYPAIQIITFLPASINRLVEVASGESYYWLTVIQVIFDTTSGLMFSLVYGFNPQVQKALADCCKNIFKGRRISHQSINEGNNSNELSIDSQGRKKRSSSLSYLEEVMISD